MSKLSLVIINLAYSSVGHLVTDYFYLKTSPASISAYRSFIIKSEDLTLSKILAFPSRTCTSFVLKKIFLQFFHLVS